MEVINEEFVSERYKTIKETETIHSERDDYGNYKNEEKCYKVHYKIYDITKKCSNCADITEYTEEHEVDREEISCSGWGTILGLATLGILGSS